MQYKLEILHMQGDGYVHLDSPIVNIRDSSADDFKRGILSVAIDVIEEAEIGDYEKPDLKRITKEVLRYWNDNIDNHMDELMTSALRRGDANGLIDTSSIVYGDVEADLPELDEGALYDVLDENVEGPDYYAELRMTAVFGVSVIDIHGDNDKPGHNSFVRVIAIKLDGEK